MIEIFGFIMICVLLGYITFAGVGAFIVANGFAGFDTGRTIGFIVFAALMLCAWYLTFTHAPFTIMMVSR